MGTNYYTVHPDGTRRHLGKTSAGWKFGFYAPKEWGRENAFVIWEAILFADMDQGAYIEDEYGDRLTEKELMDRIEARQHLRSRIPDRPGERAAWRARGAAEAALYDSLRASEFDCNGYDFCDREFS